MADEDKVIIEVELDSKSVGKGFKRVEKKGSKAAKKLDNKFSKAFSGLKSKVIGLGLAIGAAFAGRKILDAANRQEEAVNNLNIALRLAGDNVKLLSKDIRAFASDIEATTRVGDEFVLELFTLARTFTDTAEQAKTLVKNAIDLSAGTGGALTLDSAVKNLGKTFGGLIGELGEVLPGLKQFTVEQLKTGAALEFVAKRFGGAAQQQVSTFSGTVDRAGNAFGTLLENIGLLLTQSPDMIVSLTDLTKKFINLSNAIVKAFPDTFADEVTKLETRLKSLTETRARVQATLINIIKRQADGFKDADIQAEQLEKRLVTVSQEIRKTSDALFKLTKQNEGTGESTFFKGLRKQLQELNKEVLRVKLTIPREQLDKLKLDSEEQTNILLQAFNNRLINEQQFQEKLGVLRNNFTKKRQELLIKAGNKEAVLAKNLSDGVKNALVGGIANGIQAIGAAFVRGENIFEQFGKSLFGIFGDVLIIVGIAILTTGKAIEALKASIVTFFGGFAIAAGIALIALGGAMKALSGGGASSSIGGTAGAGGTGGGGEDLTDTAQVEDIEERATQVTINVEGTVIDPKTTGLQIAEILEQTFESTGVRVIGIT